LGDPPVKKKKNRITQRGEGPLDRLGAGYSANSPRAVEGKREEVF